MINTRELQEMFGDNKNNRNSLKNIFDKIDEIIKYYIISFYIFIFTFVFLECYKIKL